MGRTYLADIPGNFFVAKIGTNASIASNGAGAILADTLWRAPDNCKILSAHRLCHSDEVTKGTATTSASYRRFNLINGGSAGTGTTIVASLNQTASLASYATRAFTTTANNTLSQGEILLVSHLTVGAETADGTSASAGTFQIAYELL